MLAPFLVFGLPVLRWRWFALGCGLWLLAFLGTEEVLPYFRPFAGRARARFWSARMAFNSYMASGGTLAGTVEVPLRVITWNIREGTKDARASVEQLAALDPDIVLFQEFWPGREVTMREALQESDHFRAYYVAGRRRAILSRWPVKPFDDSVAPRSLSTAWRVEVAPGLSIICVNAHLTPLALKTQLLRGWSWRHLQRAVARTRRELTELRAALEFYAQRGSVVLGGDFNLPPYYPELRRATASFKDCFRANGFGWGKTAPVKLPAMRPDMIFVPPASRVYYAGAVPTQWSDHYMTLVEVAVPVVAQQSLAAPSPEAGEAAGDPNRSFVKEVSTGK